MALDRGGEAWIHAPQSDSAGCCMLWGGDAQSQNMLPPRSTGMPASCAATLSARRDASPSFEQGGKWLKKQSYLRERPLV